MSRIKVAHITTVDQSLRFLLLDQMKFLQIKGFEVVGVSATGPNVEVLENHVVRHIAVPMTRAVGPLADLLSLWRLIRILRRERFTIIHTHTPKASLLGHLAGRIARTPVILSTLHGYYLHDQMGPATRKLYLLTERVSAMGAMSILSQNQEDMQTAIEEGICPATKMKYLGNGIDLDVFEPGRVSSGDLSRKRNELGIEEGAPVVGFVGRLAARRKGFLDFLSSCARIRQQVPDARFLIVGESDIGKPDSVDPTVAERYGIDDACLFLGRRPNEELPLLYSLMNVIVLPSLFEGLPRVIMEASAMGIPAVASNVKGNREAIIVDQNGVLVEYGDVDAITRETLRLLTDNAYSGRLRQSSRKIAIERFDQQNVFQKVEQEYVRLLREKRLPLPEPIDTPDTVRVGSDR